MGDALGGEYPPHALGLVEVLQAPAHDLAGVRRGIAWCVGPNQAQQLVLLWQLCLIEPTEDIQPALRREVSKDNLERSNCLRLPQFDRQAIHIVLDGSP